MARPTFVIVSGPPGSGKSQLAQALGEAIGCPVISRDRIKEGMVHAHGEFQAAPGDELTKRTFPLFVDAIRLLLVGGVTVIAEAAFQDRIWRQGLTSLMSLAELRVIHCQVEAGVAKRRMELRMSEPTRTAHADAGWVASAPTAFERPSLDAPSLVVDTTTGYVPDLDAIIAFIGRPDGAATTPPIL